MYQDNQIIEVKDLKLDDITTEGKITIFKVRDGNVSFRLEVPKIYKDIQTTMSLEDFERFQENLRTVGYKVNNQAYYNL